MLNIVERLVVVYKAFTNVYIYITTSLYRNIKTRQWESHKCPTAYKNQTGITYVFFTLFVNFLKFWILFFINNNIFVVSFKNFYNNITMSYVSSKSLNKICHCFLFEKIKQTITAKKTLFRPVYALENLSVIT